MLYNQRYLIIDGDFGLSQLETNCILHLKKYHFTATNNMTGFYHATTYRIIVEDTCRS
jgi:hypothetical protein